MNNIIGALETILTNFADANGYDVSWPNNGYEPDITKPYLKPYLMPAETAAPALSAGGFQSLAGIYQVNINVANGLGEQALREMTDQVLTAFSRGTTQTVNDQKTTIEKSWSSQVIGSDGWQMIPVSIRYRSIA